MIINIYIPQGPGYIEGPMESNGEFFADKLMDLANMGTAALVFGQILGNQIQWAALLLGFSFLIFSAVVSFFLRRGEK